MPQTTAPPDAGAGAGADMPALLDQAPCGFLSFRDDGIIVAANTTVARMLGAERQDLEGAPMDHILTVAARIFYQTHFLPLITLHGRAEEVYFTLKSHSGEPVHVLVNAERRQKPDEPARNECVLLRIHERQKYERELLLARRAAEDANVAKSRFLSMMSHDLRTPLNAVSGYADLMLLGIHGDLTEQQKEDLGRIKAASGYLLGLLNDILTFARIEIGQVQLEIETIPVKEALTRAESIVAPRVQQVGVTYARGEMPDDLAVCADGNRLQQILLNLLTNAAKFTPRGGSIAVDAARSGDNIHIHVRDTGRGIPADELTRIFEPFVQVEKEADQANQGGVGLGLAISRDLARAMGGDLGATSEPGQGSVFTVTLPAA